MMVGGGALLFSLRMPSCPCFLPHHIQHNTTLTSATPSCFHLNNRRPAPCASPAFCSLPPLLPAQHHHHHTQPSPSAHHGVHHRRWPCCLGRLHPPDHDGEGCGVGSCQEGAAAMAFDRCQGPGMCGGERWYMWAHKKSVLLVPIFCRSHKLTQRDTRSAHTHTPHRTQTHAYTHPGTRTPTRHVCFLATYQESYTPINPPSTRTPCENTPILPPSSPFLFSSSIGYSLSLSCALSLSPPPPLPPPLAR